MLNILLPGTFALKTQTHNATSRHNRINNQTMLLTLVDKQKHEWNTILILVKANFYDYIV